MIAKRIADKYSQEFGEAPQMMVMGPGRINLLGEHIDYNDGIVLPGAVDKGIYVAIGKATGSNSKVISSDYDNYVEFGFEDLKPESGHWSAYITGVIKQLLRKGVNLGSFNAVFGGDIPVGSGMSSSAALECSFGYALNKLFEGNLSRTEIALAGQKAEHEFVGVECGIMDQYASVFGKKDHIIEIDCQNLNHSYHKLETGDYSFVLFNSKVHHELVSSEYNKRRSECEEGLAMLNAYNPDFKSFRDVTLSDLNNVRQDISTKSFQRCTFVIEEIERVKQILNAINSNQLVEVGQIMSATHRGLSETYEVCCPETDYLFELVEHEKDVLGSRQMGGGFGGCTINLLKTDSIERIVSKVQTEYHRKYGIDMEYYQIALSDGVREINLQNG